MPRPGPYNLATSYLRLQPDASIEPLAVSEGVCLLSGSVSFVLQEPARRRAITLQRNGAYVIVPRGTRHTAKAVAPSQMLFVTAGEGTQHRDARR